MTSQTISNRQLRLGLAQINPCVGNLDENVLRIAKTLEAANNQQVQLLLFPELALTGYPPEDLLLKPNFIHDTHSALLEIVHLSARYPELTIVVGYVESADDLYNAAAVIAHGELVGTYHKHYLPNYGVFDENRYFQAGQETPLFIINGVKVGINICEDIWYADGPATLQGYAGAEVLANISASPFHIGKRTDRERMLATRASDTGSIVAYVNVVGGQDELVFDGSSCVFDERGKLIARAPAFREHVLVVDLDVEGIFRQRLHDPRLRKARLDTQNAVEIIFVSDTPQTVAHTPRSTYIEPPVSDVAEVYDGLVIGVHDYIVKNGFKEVVIGLSGGIDSALTAAIAVDALGSQAVHGVLLPSQFSSQGSLDDAIDLAQRLRIHTLTLPIQPGVDAIYTILHDPLHGKEPGITYENLQSRTRGIVLMALSNANNWLVLTTGNKSEMATGYATLYGDMVGGFAVLKDVWKTLVYDLARLRNTRSEVIPVNSINKPPSAELRPDQQDTDSLPPYETLDPILHAYVEEDRGLNEIVAMGFAEEDVRRIMRMVDHSEYKRRQAAPGVKVTPRAFGRDRRLPLTNSYLEWRK